MSGRKISELRDFSGKKLLLKAQEKGLEITKGSGVITDATAIMLLGLARLLVENGLLKDE